LKTVVSTVNENLMSKVHNLYRKVCNVRRQNSCNKFYKVGSVDTLVRWGGQLSCHAMSNYVRNFGIKNY